MSIVYLRGGGLAASASAMFLFVLSILLMAAESPLAASVTVQSYGPNVVSVWNGVATNTINVAPALVGTDEEKRPIFAVDLATVHVAIYDAVNAIAGTHKPYAVAPTASAGASMDMAASAAAYRVLKGLFPNRSSVYQGMYDSFLASTLDGDAKARGIAVGTEVALRILAIRHNDGRSVELAPYVPGSAPGQFRGTNPINRFLPYVKPFAMRSAAQFRADGPPALASDAYTEDFNETKSFGAINSVVRTPEQTEIARFHTEPPPLFWPRNLRQFAMSNPSVVENARLMALLWIAFADASIGCFESKYHFEFWRPLSAIPLADSDGNDATVADASWTPVVPTPNHPEYPAAHTCGGGAIAEVLSHFLHTRKIAFDFGSTVTGTVHHFDSTDDMVDELQDARVYGGMHFRTSTVDGAALGRKVGKWVTKHHCGRRD